MSRSSVQIPAPCSQQWADMKPVEGGRFCENCRKMVVDFTAMSNTEVTQVMAQQRGNACGRFRAEQLNRPLRTYSPAPYAQQRLFGLLTAGLLGWHTTLAQVGQQEIAGDQSSVRATGNQMKDQLLSNTSVSRVPGDSSIIVIGRVTSEFDGSDVQGAYVLVKETSISTFTDITGSFRLVVPSEYTSDPLVLGVSSIGFVHQEVSLKLNQQGPLLLTLSEDTTALGEVIVVGNYKKPSFLDRLRNRLPIKR